ncbi:prolyl endopeptidase-like [Planococcus citri]|uniref:prolyl endopeptidase-like n=1 Tax=Planococcus citri TaxID=170843 RepID=UPI0031F9D941
MCTMTRKLVIIEFITVVVIMINYVHGQGGGSSGSNVNITLNYPNPRRDENVSDIYPKNTIVKDPYRWMENLDSEETKKFIEAENALTRSYLDKSPFRAELEARFKELYNYHRYTSFFQKGKHFFSYQNTGLQNQDVLFIHDSLTSDGKVFFDPNTLSKDGTIALYSASTFSEDGQIFAYMLGANGSDWTTIQFKHIEQGDIYKEKLEKVKHSLISWTHDNKGIFYSAYLEQKYKKSGELNFDKDKNHKLYYHVIGTEQSKDVMVAEFPNHPDYWLEGSVSDCGKYLIVAVNRGTGNLIYIADLEKINYQINGKLEFIPIGTKAGSAKDILSYITNDGKTFIFKTNKDADNSKLVSINIENPDPNTWKDLVPENKTDVLEWASPASDKYVVLCYIQNVKNILQIHDIKTGNLVKKFDLEIGSVFEWSFFSERKSSMMFFILESFLNPGIVYSCDLSIPSLDLKIIRENKLKNFDPRRYTTEQVFYKSKDGTEVPMFLTYKKGLELHRDGNTPTFLYGYGGFLSSESPYFSVNPIAFINNFDGIYAVASIRGGGEYGEKWHLAGNLGKKQNTFDDFQAAAEYLIAQNYTKASLLTINGLSNGGLLMGACLNQRPDLFGAVIAQVGLFDMLRYDKFTTGFNWIPEYGSPSNETDFEYLFKYSPLHNIKIPDDPNKQYPATMLLTSDHDDRVVPSHSLKFIATLRHEAKSHPNQKNPFILRVESDAGHGGGEPTEKVIARLVDEYCFIIMNTGIKFHK